MTLLVPSSAASQPRNKGAVKLLASGLALVAALFLTRGPSFIPGTPPTPVEASNLDGFRALEAATNSKLVDFGAKLQECMEETKMTLADAFEVAISQDDDDLVGPSLNPQLLPAGSAPLPQQKDAVQQIIEPLTKLYMRYRCAMYPRCAKSQPTTEKLRRASLLLCAARIVTGSPCVPSLRSGCWPSLLQQPSHPAAP